MSLDQSTKCTGFCIMVDKKIEKSGVLKIENADKLEVLERFRIMFKYISDLIEDVNPDYLVLESCQFQNNYSVYAQLNRLQGLIMGYLFQKEIGFVFIEPTAWKSCCKIQGRKRVEQKKNTIQFVLDTYGLSVSEDEADAIGIATWGNKNLQEIKGDK